MTAHSGRVHRRGSLCELRSTYTADHRGLYYSRASSLCILFTPRVPHTYAYTNRVLYVVLRMYIFFFLLRVFVHEVVAWYTKESNIVLLLRFDSDTIDYYAL